MREFTELQTLSDHACGNPHVEHLEVYEPIAMQTCWLTIFRCCSRIFSEAYTPIERLPALRALPAQVEAA